MLERLIGGVVVVGSLSLCSGCVSFKEYDVSKIENVVPVVRHAEAELKDFGDLSWDEVIEFVETPEQARAYCKWLARKPSAYTGLFLDSFKSAHEGFSVDCSEGAYATAALLSDNGYPQLVLLLETAIGGGNGHIVFMYKQDDKFGSLGLNDFDCISPDFTSVNDLAKRISEKVSWEFPYMEKKLQFYMVSDLAECDPDFIQRRWSLFHHVCSGQNEIK